MLIELTTDEIAAVSGGTCAEMLEPVNDIHRGKVQLSNAVGLFATGYTLGGYLLAGCAIINLTRGIMQA